MKTAGYAPLTRPTYYPGSFPLPGFGRRITPMARASNLVIGTATLTVIAVAFGGLLGVQKWRASQSRSQLRVVFEGGSASGLRRGGPVNFDGVPAGQILSIQLQSPRKVVALVSL